MYVKQRTLIVTPYSGPLVYYFDPHAPILVSAYVSHISYNIDRMSLADTSLMECPSMASPMSRQETSHLLLFREHVLAIIPTVATLFLISTCPLQFTRCQLTSNSLFWTTTLIRLYKRDFGEFRLPVMSPNQCSIGCLVAGPLTHLVYQLWDTTRKFHLSQKISHIFEINFLKIQYNLFHIIMICITIILMIQYFFIWIVIRGSKLNISQFCRHFPIAYL